MRNASDIAAAILARTKAVPLSGEQNRTDVNNVADPAIEVKVFPSMEEAREYAAGANRIGNADAQADISTASGSNTIGLGSGFLASVMGSARR